VLVARKAINFITHLSRSVRRITLLGWLSDRACDVKQILLAVEGCTGRFRGFAYSSVLVAAEPR
jgi:hypothetical protein